MRTGGCAWPSLTMANLAAGNLLAGLEGGHPPTLLNPQAWEQRASRG